MNHADHVELIRQGVAGSGPVWADLGSGTGAFTLALADVLGSRATIHSIDLDAAALRRQATELGGRFPDVQLIQQVADFSRPLELPALDGIVMANSLHFAADKRAVLHGLVDLLRPNGRFVLVEYDTDSGNPWVPYPISYASWQALAENVGLRETRRLAAVPSRFLGSIYSALSVR